jgi:hypothetical protein
MDYTRLSHSMIEGIYKLGNLLRSLALIFLIHTLYIIPLIILISCDNEFQGQALITLRK